MTTHIPLLHFGEVYESLDTADTERFPVAQFGPVNLTHGHTDQMSMRNIAEAMARYGARQDGEEARSRKSISQKKGMHINDVCWRCWPGNYGRYIEQLDPLATSVGRWRLGPKDQPHGRFARALELEIVSTFSWTGSSARRTVMQRRKRWP